MAISGVAAAGAMPAAAQGLSGDMMPFGPAGLNGASEVRHAGAAGLMAVYQHEHRHCHDHHHHDDALLCIMGLALLQSGLHLQGIPPGSSFPLVSTAVSAPGQGQGVHDQSARQSMHQMLSSVAKACKGHSGHDGFADGLQGLIAAMSVASAGGQPVHPLHQQVHQDFNLMVSAIQGNGAIAPQLNVVSFLQNLQHNLGNVGLPSIGGLLNTTA